MNATSLLRPTAVLAALVAVGCGASAPTQAPVASPSCPPASAPAVADDGLSALTDEQLARKLLDVTGASDLGKQVGDGMLDSFRKMPNLPAGFIDRFKQNMHAETLVDLVVPIYLKHFDRETMIAAIRFYESGPGKRMVVALPAAMTEAMAAGKQWGTALAQKTLRDLGAGAP